MDSQTRQLLHALPSISDLLKHDRIRIWLSNYSEFLVADGLRQVVGEFRKQIHQKRLTRPVKQDEIVDRAERILRDVAEPSLRRVINATGIVLHTGLGRAPLSASAWAAIQECVRGYCNLELDLETGQRGRRCDHVAELLCRLSGAEAATVVNNNAAATLLVLKIVAQHYAKNARRYRQRQVIVSRGQLVEIGGSFRLPEIMKASGVQLCEVGTTNRTRLSDYVRAMSDRTAALMRVHTSNYQVTGFTQDVSIQELVGLGKKHGLPVIDDLGSGLLVPIDQIKEPQALACAELLQDEPLVSHSVHAGADLICFSGDKLLGGPQAGIILGRKKFIQALEEHPLMRTYRVDKLTLAALEATLQPYLRPEKTQQEIPVWGMLWESVAALEGRANRLVDAIRKMESPWRVNVEETISYAGGGALPSNQLPSRAVVLSSNAKNVHRLALSLRRNHPAVLTRLHKNQLIFDVRTLQEKEIDELTKILSRALSMSSG